MKKTLLLFITLSLFFSAAQSQMTRHIVRFKNKGDNPFSLTNPAGFLSQRSIDRRTRYSIAYDSTDLPVTPRYVDSVRLAGAVTILNVSKWLNQVSIQTTDANALTKINSFPFVESVTVIGARIGNSDNRTANHKFGEVNDDENTSLGRTSSVMADFFNYGNSFAQINIHNGQFLHNIGMRGQTMMIGMLDAGFFNYTTLRSFDSVNLNGQVLSTWDFVNREPSVTEDNSHGMQCFSIIAANIPGTFVGSAPKAQFHLFRTEEAATEYPIEEHNWVCGAERVDSAGSDVISSSLGYNTFDNPTFDHTYAEMNGNTTMVTKGADLAAKKGILVFNSQGNDGTSAWHFLAAPADGDSVVAVGAVSATGAVAGFSGYGPSSDGQIKPDLASVGQGTTIQLTNNNIGSGNGTSFACPNLAGLGTCLWQAFPEYNNMRILTALKRASTKFSMPDDRVGYGIPNMKLAFADILTEYSSGGGNITNCRSNIAWTSKDVSSMRYEIERKAPGETSFTKVHERAATGGDVLSLTAYFFNDTLINVTAGSISYRIRQIIDTSEAGFTAVTIDSFNLILSSPCITTGVDPVDPNAESLIILPNPARSQFTLRLRTNYPVQNLNITILDMEGRLVSQYRRSKQTGESSFSFPIQQLAAGKYVVAVYDGERLIGSKELLKY